MTRWRGGLLLLGIFLAAACGFQASMLYRANSTASTTAQHQPHASPTPTTFAEELGASSSPSLQPPAVTDTPLQLWALEPWTIDCPSAPMQTVRITGRGFSKNTFVMFASLASPTVRPASDGSSITATLPSGLCSVGLANVPIRVGNFDETLHSTSYAKASLVLSIKKPKATKGKIKANKPQLSTSVRKVAITFEAQGGETILYVVNTFLRLLPEEWHFQLFVTPTAAAFFRMADGVSEGIADGRVNLTLLDPHFSRNDYMAAQLDVRFWERVLGDRVLLFHSDSMICEGSPHTIDEFDNWDYLGAPWPNEPIGGNSGFSLRNREPMMKLLRDKKSDVKRWIKEHTGRNNFEDVFIAHYGPSTGMRVAPAKVEKLFSVEQISAPNPFGCHKPWGNLDKRNLNMLIRQCPTLKPIIPAKYRSYLGLGG